MAEHSVYHAEGITDLTRLDELVRRSGEPGRVHFHAPGASCNDRCYSVTKAKEPDEKPTAPAQGPASETASRGGSGAGETRGVESSHAGAGTSAAPRAKGEVSACRKCGATVDNITTTTVPKKVIGPPDGWVELMISGVHPIVTTCLCPTCAALLFAFLNNSLQVNPINVPMV